MPNQTQVLQAELRQELYELTEDLIDAHYEQNEDAVLELNELIRLLHAELDLTN